MHCIVHRSGRNSVLIVRREAGEWGGSQALELGEYLLARVTHDVFLILGP